MPSVISNRWTWEDLVARTMAPRVGDLKTENAHRGRCAAHFLPKEARLMRPAQGSPSRVMKVSVVPLDTAADSVVSKYPSTQLRRCWSSGHTSSGTDRKSLAPASHPATRCNYRISAQRDQPGTPPRARR